MADSFVQVPVDSTGKLVDCEQLTVGANTVQRERHELCGASAAEVARVLNSQPAGSEYALVTREAQKGQATMANSIPVVVASDQSGLVIAPSTTGGNSAYHAVAAATNNAAVIKASAGKIYGWSIYNNASYPIYVKFYNKATAPAPATDNALLIRVLGVQAGTHVDHASAFGIGGFASGIGIAAVKGITDTDNTSLAASDALLEVDWQ